MKIRLSSNTIPLLATSLVCLILYLTAGFLFRGFFSIRVLINFFTDNSFLGIVAIGLTFVILSGGIDLSVGAMIGFTSILLAKLITQTSLSPWVAFLLILGLGAVIGAGAGAMIQLFHQPPFLVTLASMFLIRGLGFVINIESISIQHPLYRSLSEAGLPLPGGNALPLTAIIFLTLFAIGLYLATHTRFGRNTYALGGNEQSAVLMGLPVQSVKIRVYAFSGFCSALGGIVYSLYTCSGNPTAGTMLELDAIAAVVIGGTLLSGGVGSVWGALLGVLILGIIQTAITFQGNLSSWWTRIVIGILLMLFILLQKIIQRTTLASRL